MPNGEQSRSDDASRAAELRPARTSTRRAFVTALAAIPVVAAPATAVAATNLALAEALPSRKITEAIAAYHKAVANQNEWEGRVYFPTWNACKAAIEAIPHLTTEQGFETYAGFKVTHLSTDKVADVALARMFSKLPASKRLDDDHDRACAELLDKLEWRAAEEVRIHARYNMDALDEEQDRLNDISYRAMIAVEDYPAATLADLIAKTEFGLNTEGRIDHEDLLADLRRISGEASPC